MKKVAPYSILFLLFILLDFYTIEGQASYRPIYVEAQKWVKGNKNIPWQFFETRIIDRINGYVASGDTLQAAYGSSSQLPRFPATGFFRIEQANGRWWIVDPLGYLHIQRAVNGLRQGGSEQNRENFTRKFGSDESWVRASVADLHQMGFNGAGAWSRDDLIDTYNQQNRAPISHTINLALMAKYGRKRGGTYQLAGNIGFPNQTIFVFDPEFEVFCDSILIDMSLKTEDAALLGYFSDNELPFGLKNLEGYLNLSNPSDPGRIAAEQWLRERRMTKENISDKDRADFAGYVVDKYYQICSRIIKKHDPNHLYLGSRLHGQAKFIPQILVSAGRYCDIVSINYYGVWTPSANHVADWTLYAQKPFMITEFYTKGMDSGLANTTGAGFAVRTQTDRGYAYQNFCLSLLESKACVGWHFFKYQDNDPTAKNVDPSNVDSNKGLVDNRYQYYTPMTQLMTQLNKQVYSLIEYFDNH